MYKNGTLFFLFIVAIQARQYVYETGKGIEVTDVKGTVDLNIIFKRPYTEIPRVAYAINTIEMSGNILDSEILKVTQEGFTIRVTSDFLQRISYNWLVTDNPLFDVEYIKSKEASVHIKRGLSNSFVIGFETEGDKAFIQQLDNGEVQIQSPPKYYKLCVVRSKFEHTYNNNQIGMIADQIVDQQQSIDLPEDVTNSVSLIGLTGFKSGQYLKVQSKSFIASGQFNIQYGSLDDSILTEVSFGAIFIGDEKVEFLDKKCVHLFSECGYQSFIGSICNQQQLIDFKGQVKSIQLPRGAIFTLYEDQSYGGKQIRLDQSKECLKDDGIKVGQ